MGLRDPDEENGLRLLGWLRALPPNGPSPPALSGEDCCNPNEKERGFRLCGYPRAGTKGCWPVTGSDS